MYSDSRKTTLTTRGHQEISVDINWGSKGDSRRAVSVIVNWPKGAEKPIVHIHKAGELE